MKRPGMMERLKPLLRTLRALGLALALALGFAESAMAQGGNGITKPASAETVAGIVIIEGTATDPNFLRYELAFLREANAGAGWIVFAEGDQPVTAGTLAVWDTTVGRNVGAPVFPDGVYQLRLRVVRTDYNYNEYFVTGIAVTNDEPTPTPTAEGTPAAADTPAPQPGETVEGTQPGVLPTLTPFPTPSPQATPIDALLGPGDEAAGGNSGERQGVFERLAAIDTGRFGAAFWQGVGWTAVVFGLLAVYLLVRAMVRWLWRLVMTRVLR